MQETGEVDFGTTSQSSLRDASSPGRKDSLRPEGDVANSDRGRMTTGESVVAVLDEQSFLQSGTTGLRCLDSRLLAPPESFFHKFSKKTCKI